MKREFLKNLGLTEEQTNQVMAEYGKGIDAEKSKIETKDKEIDSLKEQVKTANETIDSYKDMNIEEIKESLDDYKQKYEESEEEKNNIKNNATLKDALIKTGTIDSDILIKLLDRETLEFNDEEIKGLDTQIEKLKESKPFLFETDNSGSDNNLGFNSYVPPNSNTANSGSDLESQIKNVFKD